MPPSPNKNRSTAIWAGLGLAVLLAGLLAYNAQSIQDWWRLRGYQPPAAISQLAVQDTMTPYARHLFYLNKPQLVASVTVFRQDCPENENTIVLGCYHPGENGIYIYRVRSADLQGVTQVTSAHEVLHAGYTRLDAAERKRIDGLLMAYYEHGLTNQRIKDEIHLYQKTEPNSVLDEMHSVFGTEATNLPASLENYYKRYFTDRAVIVAFGQQYEQAFTSRQDKIQAYDAQLADMKQKIDAQEAALRVRQADINALQERLKALLASGDSAAYNAQIPAYNNQVAAYNAGVASLKVLITRYNQLVNVRNTVAGELTTLGKALDTRSAPMSAH